MLARDRTSSPAVRLRPAPRVEVGKVKLVGDGRAEDWAELAGVELLEKLCMRCRDEDGRLLVLINSSPDCHTSY